MTDAELEGEIALALLGGASGETSGTYRFHGTIITYKVIDRRPGQRIEAQLSLRVLAPTTTRDPPKLIAQTSCSVWTFVELQTTTIAWGIGNVLDLERIHAKQGAP